MSHPFFGEGFAGAAEMPAGFGFILFLFYHFQLNFDCELALFDVGVVGLWGHMETTEVCAGL